MLTSRSKVPSESSLAMRLAALADTRKARKSPQVQKRLRIIKPLRVSEVSAASGESLQLSVVGNPV